MHARDDPHDELRRLRRHRTGDLLADGTPTPVRFIIDGRSGAFVLPAERSFFEADETVLWIPRERYESFQVLVRLEPLEHEFDEAKDRYLAYHGKHEAYRWARASIESARREGVVSDADELMRVNLLHAEETRLCKLLNADKDRLARLCEDMVKTRPRDPVAVGVDEDGIDVRASVGVMRLEMPRRARNADDAEAMIRGLLEPGL